MTHQRMLKTLVLECQNRFFWIPFQNWATKTKLTDEKGYPSSYNCFQSYYWWGHENNLGQGCQDFTGGVSNHGTNSCYSQVLKNRSVKICFQQTCIRWLPNDFPWQLLCCRLHPLPLKVRKVMLCKIKGLL